MNIFEVKNLTKDYKHNRGVFDISFAIKKGEVFGFLGPNGAGKTTTVRHLLGFIKSDMGECHVDGHNSWKYPELIQKNIGYIPGEISLPDNISGLEFISLIAEMRGMTDMSIAEELIKKFNLDTSGKIKKMSKGTKQKLGIVVAFMHDPKYYILDEPSSGLDPLKQAEFIELIRSEKAKGKTILLSSHMFDEVERTCDRVSIIKNGRIITTINIKEIEHRASKTYEIKFKTKAEFQKFKNGDYDFFEVNEEKQRVKVNVEDIIINEFIDVLSKYELQYVSEVKYTLEDYFMRFYKEEEQL